MPRPPWNGCSKPHAACASAAGYLPGEERASTLLYLLDVEVTQALRRFVAVHGLSVSRAEEALQDLIDLRIHRYTHAPFLRRIWALRNNLTSHDALYVALAESLDAPMLTCDAKLAAAPKHRVRIEVI